MPAPKGNKNAVGNNGGRPPIYDGSKPEDVEKVSELCLEYFEYIQGEYKEDEKEVEHKPEEFIIFKEWIRKPEPPTVTGLTLYLGFDNKSTLYDYSRKVEFSNSIKRALTMIEQYHEIAASHGDKCTGNIFILKNFGWKDNTTIEHSGEIKSSAILPLNPQQAKELLENLDKDI